MAEEVKKTKRSKKKEEIVWKITCEVKGVIYDEPPQWVIDHISNVFAGLPTTYKPDWGQYLGKGQSIPRSGG